MCFTGQTVDVVTSSQDLAKKDREDFALFYQNLGLKVSRDIITSTSKIDIYVKGGINYSVASDLALFRASREFYDSTDDLELRAEVSLIANEIDFVLTSGINYKLATSIVDLTQKEARILYQYIIDFTNTEYFNYDVSKQDDIINLKKYLDRQFYDYDSSYHYPLSKIQINALSKNTLRAEHAEKILNLDSALSKLDYHIDELFDKLLSAVLQSKKIVEKKIIYFQMTKIKKKVNYYK